MGFFGKLSKTWKLVGLQKEIHPPAGHGSLADQARAMAANEGNRKRAMEQYLDLCEADPEVHAVMRSEGLSRSDLEQIYASLLAGGLGWTSNGHAALSTIANGEPLQYVLLAKKKGVNRVETLSTLSDYWDGRIARGSLLRAL